MNEARSDMRLKAAIRLTPLQSDQHGTSNLHGVRRARIATGLDELLYRTFLY
jgi:hypothetical protein